MNKIIRNSSIKGSQGELEFENIIKNKLPDNYDYEKARDLFKNCDKYKDEYDNINVNVEELFDNQLDNIRNYVSKNSNLSIKQINNRFKKIYSII